jgi:pyruvate,water dikinase
VIATLEEWPEGQVFLSELVTYLNEYGQRGHKIDGLAEISWLEDPTPVIKRLKDYLTQPDRDLEAELKLQAAEREQLIRQTMERLKDYPQPIVGKFEQLLKAAQTAAFLHEEHNYWIDQRAQYQVRRVILEFGRRFTEAGRLSQPDDIFYLTIAEIRESTQNLSGFDWPERVATRRAELAYFQSITPPPAIGTMPLMGPPDDPFGRSFGKVLGAPPIPTGQTAPSKNGLLRGLAGSPGLVRGRARVIRNLAEMNQLQPGDILVAEATMPPWTPLFGIASAVVTDVGGILSHCAVVAREYQIPAVVGVGTATTTIQDGQMVEVDGKAGTVRLLEE